MSCNVCPISGLSGPDLRTIRRQSGEMSHVSWADGRIVKIESTRRGFDTAKCAYPDCSFRYLLLTGEPGLGGTVATHQ